MKYAMEISESNIILKAKIAIKGQELADFVAEFTNAPKVKEVMEPAKLLPWNL